MNVWLFLNFVRKENYVPIAFTTFLFKRNSPRVIFLLNENGETFGDIQNHMLYYCTTMYYEMLIVCKI